MQIMVRGKSGDGWQKVTATSFLKESELQSLLLRNPDLIPMEVIESDRKPIRISLQEAGLPGSGKTDLIGLDEDGNVLIVETKLAANEEIKRKVIGQVLEYAAYLWAMSFEDFARLFQERLGKTPVELMADASTEEDWDPEAFRTSVAENLRDGRFTLLIVVDEINPELRRIIDFLNMRTNGELSLYALELKYFKSPSGEIVFPQVYGATAKSVAARPKLAIWDEPQFRQSAETHIQDPKARQLLLDLLDFAKTHGFRLEWGKGKDLGRVRICVPHPKAKKGHLALYRLRSDANVKLGFGRIVRDLPKPEGPAAVDRLMYHWKIPTIQKWFEEDHRAPNGTIRGGWPGSGRYVAAFLPDAKTVADFKAGVLAFKDEIQPQ
jgi:hypothetical protein